MAEMQNLKRVLARLKRVPEDVRDHVATQLKTEVDGMVDAMRRAVPVDTGTLKRTIHAEPGSRPLSWRIRAGGAATTKKIRKGVSDRDFARALGRSAADRKARASRGEYDYALGVEFGHMDGDKHVPAKPFFFPTYRARKKGVQRRLKTAARRAVKPYGPTNT